MFMINKVSSDIDLDDKIISHEMMLKCFTTYLDEESINNILTDLDIDRETYDKITKIFDEYGYKMRYWAFYGRTLDEYENECIFNEMVMKDKPKNNTLLECLSLLSTDSRETIYDYYDFRGKSDSKLIEKIITSFDI